MSTDLTHQPAHRFGAPNTEPTPRRGRTSGPIEQFRPVRSQPHRGTATVQPNGPAQPFAGVRVQRRTQHATVPQVRHGQLQVDAWVTANINYHAYLPSVSGNAAVQQAYERLSITDHMLRALSTDAVILPRVAQDHIDLVEAYERGDLASARDILIGHTTAR